MMRYFPPRLSALVLEVCILIIMGCAASQPTRFYVLSSLADSGQTQATEAARDSTVGVGPVKFPEHLDRPQIVTRTSQNELNLADFDRGAEPLKDSFTQVLAENLAVLLPSKQVEIYPWKRATPIDYQVVVKVTRFDRSEGWDSILNVRWSILGNKAELLTKTASYSEHPAGPDYPATVAAMNQTLAAFSRDVATAIRELQRNSKRQ